MCVDREEGRIHKVREGRDYDQDNQVKFFLIKKKNERKRSLFGFLVSN